MVQLASSSSSSSHLPVPGAVEVAGVVGAAPLGVLDAQLAATEVLFAHDEQSYERQLA